MTPRDPGRIVLIAGTSHLVGPEGTWPSQQKLSLYQQIQQEGKKCVCVGVHGCGCACVCVCVCVCGGGGGGGGGQQRGRS